MQKTINNISMTLGLIFGVILIVLGLNIGILIILAPIIAMALNYAVDETPKTYKRLNKQREQKKLIEGLHRDAIQRRASRKEWLRMNEEAEALFERALHPERYEQPRKIQPLNSDIYELGNPRPRIIPEVVIDPQPGAVNTIPKNPDQTFELWFNNQYRETIRNKLHEEELPSVYQRMYESGTMTREQFLHAMMYHKSRNINPPMYR